MKELILIKFGGSIITDKNKEFVAREEVIQRLAKELLDSRKTCTADIILVHGSGSFAHRPAAKYRTSEGIINEESVVGFPLVADAAANINRIVVKNLIKVGLLPISFAPLSIFKTNNGKLVKYFLEPIKKACALKLIPTLYGDVIMDRTKGFCIFSAEKTISVLIKKLKRDYEEIRVIFCGDTDGVYDFDKVTIPTITQKSFRRFKKMIMGSGAVDVTGGMIHKITESVISAKKYGIETMVVNGNREGELTKAILREQTSGTIVRKA